MRINEERSEDTDKQWRRYVAISATIPNVYDFARWLSRDGMPARALVFGPEYRPVPLKQVIMAFPPHRNAFMFDNNLNFKYGHSVPVIALRRTALANLANGVACMFA